MPMFAKLSLRNMKRCASDYAIYLFTMTLSFSLIFAYNALTFYEPVKQLYGTSDSLLVMLIFVTVIMVLILGWLVSYIVRFIFEQRSREFACYMTMGMERKHISRMFISEQLVLGFMAFLAGCVLGNFIFYGITQIIYHVFDASFAMEFTYFLPALATSLACYLIMFFAVLFFENRRMKKTTVTQLLDAGKKNETLDHFTNKKHWINIILFIISIAVSMYLLYLIYFTDMRGNAMSPFLMIVSGILLFYSIMVFYRETGFVIYRHYQRHPKRLMNREKLFFYRQLTGRLTTNSRRLGVLAILGFISIMALCGSYIPAGGIAEDIADNVPFELGVYELNQDRSGNILDTEYYDEKIEAYTTITEKAAYVIYELTDSYFMEDQQITEKSTIRLEDLAITLSDYNRLRAALGYTPVTMDNDSFMIHCAGSSTAREVLTRISDFTYDGRTYGLAGCPSEHLSVSGFNGFGGLLILPDAALDRLLPERSCVVYQTKDSLPLEFMDELKKAESPHQAYSHIYQKQSYTRETKTMFLFIILLCTYTAFICLFIIGTILSVQQLSESRRTAHQYRLLGFLGAARHDLERGITGHLLIYFIVPLILPVIYSAVFLRILLHQSAFSGSIILSGTVLSAGTLAIVYGIYFLVTNHQYKKYVLDTRRKNLSDLIEG